MRSLDHFDLPAPVYEWLIRPKSPDKIRALADLPNARVRVEAERLTAWVIVAKEV